jgi:hypothetical protein
VIGLRANVLASEAQVRPQAAWPVVCEARGCCLVIGLRANVLASEAQVRAAAAWSVGFEGSRCCLMIGLRAKRACEPGTGERSRCMVMLLRPGAAL